MASELKGRFVLLRSKTTGEWFANPELRSRLVADALDKGMSLTEYVVQVLADRFGVPYEPKRRVTTPVVDARELNLRLPIGLDRANAVTAAGRGHSIPAEILVVLHAHYGLGMPVKTRRPRRRRTAAV